VARDYGIGVVQGDVLAENTRMLELGRDLGFKVSRGKEAGVFRLSMDLGKGPV
jgi:hypothetical protein